MIEIDLLPLELRERKTISLEGILKKKLIVTILAGMLLFHLCIYAVTLINSTRVNKLTKSWGDLSSRREQISQVKGVLSEINRKIPLIEQLISDRILWSKKLNGISDLLISGIWLNGLTLEQQKAKGQGEAAAKSLIIRGSAASRTKDEPALIGRFMQNLKDDPAFSKDFCEIELGPIKKRRIVQTEVMDFVLICRFK